MIYQLGKVVADESQDIIREEISKEVSNLMQEVIVRLERENPELLKSLFLSSGEASSKTKKTKVSMMRTKGKQKRPLRE